MKHAYIFPGQGAQFSGMGKTLYENNEQIKELFEQANDILKFSISDIMFTGSDEDLKKTTVTQPAIFIHSVAAYLTVPDARPDMVAGHSLGEFSALVAAGSLEFHDALMIVNTRARAMQEACELNPSAMAVILGLEDSRIEEICNEISAETGQVVVPANYNSPGQLVISGSVRGIEIACEKLKAAGAKRTLLLPVSGAFHSPLMMPAKEELAEAINNSRFKNPVCPIYQNVTAASVSDPVSIKENLIAQLTGPVKWTQSVRAMIGDGAGRFTECGPGKVLQRLVQKIDKAVSTEGIN